MDSALHFPIVDERNAFIQGFQHPRIAKLQFRGSFQGQDERLAGSEEVAHAINPGIHIPAVIAREIQLLAECIMKGLPTHGLRKIDE